MRMRFGCSSSCSEIFATGEFIQPSLAFNAIKNAARCRVPKEISLAECLVHAILNVALRNQGSPEWVELSRSRPVTEGSRKIGCVARRSVKQLLELLLRAV